MAHILILDKNVTFLRYIYFMNAQKKYIYELMKASNWYF